MAIGKSGENVHASKIQIKFGDYLVTEEGKVSKDYDEKNLKEYMKWDSINIEVNPKYRECILYCLYMRFYA